MDRFFKAFLATIFLGGLGILLGAAFGWAIVIAGQHFGIIGVAGLVLFTIAAVAGVSAAVDGAGEDSA